MENKKVSSKSTKVELLEALAEREKEIEELKKLTDDPKKEQEKAEKERVLESAAEAINSNVFSDETKIQYRDVMTAIELKKTELKDLYGIEANAQTLTAMINASKVKKAELVQEYADKEIELKVAYEAKKEEVAADTAKLVLDYKKKKEELEDDFKQVRDASNRQHIRAEEESRLERAAIFFPSKRISPAVGGSRQRRDRPNVDFPQPDSPTTPIVFPFGILKSTSSTAWRSPAGVWKYFFRCLTSRSFSSITAPSFLPRQTDGSGSDDRFSHRQAAPASCISPYSDGISERTSSPQAFL